MGSIVGLVILLSEVFKIILCIPTYNTSSVICNAFFILVVHLDFHLLFAIYPKTVYINAFYP